MFAKSSHRDKIIPHYALETAQCAAGAAFTLDFDTFISYKSDY